MYLVIWCSVWSPSGCCCVRALSVTVCSPRDRGGCTALSECSNCCSKGVDEIALQIKIARRKLEDKELSAANSLSLSRRQNSENES